MGQYFKIVNLDKKEFLNPHTLGSGLKQWEMVGSVGVSAALLILLGNSAGKGGGDLCSREGDINKDFSGHWAGDRIVIAGDYASISDGDPAEEVFKDAYDREKTNIYFLCSTDFFKDISLDIRNYMISLKIEPGRRWDL